MTFKADISEPQSILRLLEHTIKDFDITALNQGGWPDYVYQAEPCFCHNSTTYMVERKTWDDLVNNLNGVEEQLGRQLDLHPGVHAKFYIEGVVEPAMKGLLVYKKYESNQFRAGLRGNQQNTYNSIAAWIKQCKKYWDVTQTSTQAETAIMLGVDYHADNKPEESHSTFHRMFKTRNYSINPQADIILGASGQVKFGPDKAEAVAKHFKTAWRAWRAEPEEWMEIEGIGEITARTYLRNIGRPDV